MPNNIRAKRRNMFFTSKCVIENRLQPGAGVGAQSAFVRNAQRRRAAIKKDGTQYAVLCNKTT